MDSHVHLSNLANRVPEHPIDDISYHVDIIEDRYKVQIDHQGETYTFWIQANGAGRSVFEDVIKRDFLIKNLRELLFHIGEKEGLIWHLRDSSIISELSLLDERQVLVSLDIEIALTPRQICECLKNENVRDELLLRSDLTSVEFKEGVALYVNEVPQFQVNDLFLRQKPLLKKSVKFNQWLCLGEYGLGEFLAKHVSLEDREVAKKVLLFSAHMNNPALAKKAIEAHPDLIEESEVLTCALSEGNLAVARFLMRQGMNLESGEKRFLFNLFSVVATLDALNASEGEFFLEFVDEMISRGAHANFISVKEEGVPDLEIIYLRFTKWKNADLISLGVKKLLESGGQITEKMKDVMQENLKKGEELIFIDELEKRGIIERAAVQKDLLTRLDPEEEEWKEKLGNRPYLMERNGDFCSLYLVYKGEIFKFEILDKDKAIEILLPRDEESFIQGFRQKVRFFDENYFFGSRNFTEIQGWWGFDINSNFACPEIHLALSSRQIVNTIKNNKSNFLTSWNPTLSTERARERVLHQAFNKCHYLCKGAIEACFKKIESSPFYYRKENILVDFQVRDPVTITDYLVYHVSLEDKETAILVFRKAIFLNDYLLVSKVLKLYPDLVDEQAFSIGILNGNLAVIYELFDRGVSVKGLIPLVLQLVKKMNRCLTSKEYLPIIALIEELISRGADINLKCREMVAFGEQISCEAVEYAYTNRGGNYLLMQEIAYQLVSSGAKITQRMADDLMIFVREGKGVKYYEFLIRDGYITRCELDLLLAPNVEGEVDFKKEAIGAIHYLKGALKRHHLNLSLIPPEDLLKIRLLKKQIKAKLQTEEDEQLKSLFESLQKEWAALSTNHFLLSLLKEMRGTVKAQTITRKLSRFYALFSVGSNYKQTEVAQGVQSLYDPERGKLVWKAMIEKAYRVAMDHFKDPYFQFRNLTWVHGTKASNLPFVAREGGLVSLGSLLQEGKICFSGELCIRGEPNRYLSGEMLTSDWEEDSRFYLGAATRFLISLLYAIQDKGGYLEEMGMVFNADEAWSRLTRERFQSMLNLPLEDATWSHVVIDILRLRHTDPEASRKLDEYKAMVQEAYDLCEEGNPKRTNLKKILDVLTAHIEPLTEEELHQIHNPYPIVFASVSRDSIPISGRAEFKIEDRILFGEDGIEVAFTTKEHVEELSAYLEPYGIRVFDVNRALYLEALQMSKGTFHKERKDLPVGVRIGDDMQRNVIPLYATPFPPNPSYNQGGKRVTLNNPFYGHGVRSYEAYRKKVDEGEISPRHYHDPLHATRTSVWALMCHEMAKRRGDGAGVDPFLLGVAAASHDVMRMDEGEDRWDEESGQFLFSHLKGLGYESEEITPYVQALKEKDPQGDRFDTSVQEDVHDADVLEIIRCLSDPEQFQKKRLTFIHKETPGIDTDQLIQEVQQVILMTEEQGCKKWFYEESNNYFEDFLKLIFYVDQNIKPLPQMTSLLREIAQPILEKGEPLSEALKEKLHQVL